MSRLETSMCLISFSPAMRSQTCPFGDSSGTQEQRWAWHGGGEGSAFVQVGALASTHLWYGGSISESSCPSSSPACGEGPCALLARDHCCPRPRACLKLSGAKPRLARRCREPRRPKFPPCIGDESDGAEDGSWYQSAARRRSQENQHL